MPSLAPSREPGEDAVREYAFHPYQPGGGAPGHKLDDWLEATACVKANIPTHSRQNRLHLSVNGRGNIDSLCSSPAAAKREMTTLRHGRESLESAPTADDFDVRTPLFDDRP